MVIDKLELINFRNHQVFKYSFGYVNVFYGPNGVGKSNILESIAMLSFAKSFRTSHEENLIMHGENYAQIKAVVNKKNINFVIDKDGIKVKKQVRINKIKTKLTDLVGTLKTVLFTPESLEIVTGSPHERRKYMDLCLSQTDKLYLENLIQVKKIIKQRNELLKKIAINKANANELNYWNKELIENSKHIMEKRKEFCDFINSQISSLYKEISEKNDKIEVKYQSRYFEKENLEKLLDDLYFQEIRFQKTLFGPHIEDLKLHINSKAISDVGSRGEIRSLVLCLKLIEISYLENLGYKNMVLLLDDIFSELDESRRDRVINIIKSKQTIITTTDKDFVAKNLGEIKYLKISNEKN